MARPALSTKTFFEQLRSLTPNKSYLIAYSGGLDSHVLLHLCAQVKREHPDFQFRSVYIDHALQEGAADWLHHCQQIAKALDIVHRSHSLDLSIPAGESLEAVARHARYQVFAELLEANEVLLTAQHQDDQLETVLLQLFRGSGVDGLAAMPDLVEFAQGFHARPFLSYSRSDLEYYAQQHRLDYITDPSNADNRFDRNYLRNEIIPLLKQRWPALEQTVSRSARLQAEASELLGGYIEQELPDLTCHQEGTLSAEALGQLSFIHQKAVLRYWIKQAGFKAPSEVKLKHVIEDVINCAADANPIVAWQDAEIRRYRNNLYIMSPLAKLDLPRSIIWDINHPLVSEEGTMSLEPDVLGDLKSILLAQEIPVTVRFRQGGESIRPRNRQCTISLKNLFQEAGIPPWERDQIPLIYAHDQLICVPGLARIDKTELETL